MNPAPTGILIQVNEAVAAWGCCARWTRPWPLAQGSIRLVSRHRSSVGLRWPSKRIAALHRLPIQLGMGRAMRLALRSDGCAQPATSDR
ncbi:hypothetical protein Veis_1020 [Verminephrobacter eiseniae EF01-2]|uniref:Uncharacterized protein n=1 Tax=Verminephrobacter eiseniae (strain EF01-2) TaxID=391735 RepID=A1WGP0_VEREI|nr:hypothetical protein Veis_1020 [Verminephrobacter eiseniae EF01-2]